MYFLRKLLTIILRNSVYVVDGLLPDPDLHPLFTHRRHLVGLFLAQPGCNTSKGVTWCDNRANNDHTNWNDQCPTAKDFLSEVYWRLPELLLLHGVRLFDWLVEWIGDLPIQNKLCHQCDTAERRGYRAERVAQTRFYKIIVECCMDNYYTIVHKPQ